MRLPIGCCEYVCSRKNGDLVFGSLNAEYLDL